MDYLIVSAATKGSKYVACLHNKTYPRYLPIIYPSRGAWGANTKIKPDAVRDAFRRSSVVLWVDADCDLDAPESAPEGDWDICTTNNAHPDHKLRVSAAFILFRNTDKTRAFLCLWDRLNKTEKKDHPAFIKALGASDAKVADMTDWLKGRHTINALAEWRGKHAG